MSLTRNDSGYTEKEETNQAEAGLTSRTKVPSSIDHSFKDEPDGLLSPNGL